MLLQFSVNNFRSIKDTATLSLVAANADSAHSFFIKNTPLLKCAVLYGANASGKSNVLRAMHFMRQMVLNLQKITQSTDTLPHDPFRLSTETEHASSSFEAVFFIDCSKYRYGFEADDTTVYAEWLYRDDKGKEARLFERDSEIGLHYVNRQKFKEGVGLKVPENHLFLWRCDQNDGEISKQVMMWFRNLNHIDTFGRLSYLSYLPDAENAIYTSPLLANLLKVADLGVNGLKIDGDDDLRAKLEDESISDEQASQYVEMIKEFGGHIKIKLHHKVFNNETPIKTILFDLKKEESHGTQRFFLLSVLILDALCQGKILFVDELDSSLHPKMSEYLIKIFTNQELNTSNAQLIFTTHDAHLLSVPDLFERDQIWFTEKDQYGGTQLYSLLEFRKSHKGTDIRANDNLAKHYLQGRFGAVPYLGEL